MIADLGPYEAVRDSGVPWLGEVPGHWQVRRVKSLFREKEGRSGDGRGVLLSLTRTRGIVPQADASSRLAGSENLSNYKVCSRGDLVMNRMQAWSGMFAVSPLDGLISPDYSLFEATGASDVMYFAYLFKTPLLVGEFARRSKGIGSGFNRLYTPDFGSVFVAVPPAREQDTIVHFLDHVDQRIRRYIGAKQKLIRLLGEQKQAITHRAVTRGLDPDVRLKPSGVEWLGDVPAHWEVRTLGQVALSLRTGPFGSVLHQSDYVEGGIPLVNPTHMHGGDILEDRRVSVSPEVAERLSSYRLGKGDLVFSRRGELGRCALVRDREDGWICGTGTIRVELDCANLAPEYLIEALQVPWVGRYLSMSSVGSTMANLNTGILKSLPTLVPPLEEQQELLNQIGAVRRRIGRAIGAARREITLIREYRTRLIADVVTGKFDVREVAARLPEEAEESEPLADVDALIGTEDGLSDDLDAAPGVAEA